MKFTGQALAVKLKEIQNYAADYCPIASARFTVPSLTCMTPETHYTFNFLSHPWTPLKQTGVALGFPSY